MSTFTYINQELHVENVAISTITKQISTPFYVYSQDAIEQNFKALKRHLSTLPHIICFAVKSNSNQAVLKTLAKLGSGADVVSLGEIKRALHAGIKPNNIVFSGVGKTQQEISYALSQEILQFNVESEPELRLINEVAKQLGLIAAIAIRINPDVAVDTHAKITTGTAENKFGIPFDDALSLFELANDLSHIKVQGIHVHIGSQITDVEPFGQSFARVAELHKQLTVMGIKISTIDLGGGLGVCYEPGKDTPPNLSLYRQKINEELGHIDCTFIVEPGRSLVANTGCLVSKVIFKKQGNKRDFLIIDAAMNDFARPSLYDAYHGIEPVTLTNTETFPIDIVGPVCESGDTFAVQRQLPRLEAGDLLVIKDTGAYGAVMSSTYNTRPLIAEVMVRDMKFAEIRKRQSVDALINLDLTPSWL